MTKRIYLAGPMTDIPDFNYPAFNRAAAAWRAQGWVVENCAEHFEGRQDLPYRVYLRRAVQRLARHGAIALLPGWEASKGARCETHIGQLLDFEFYDAITFRQFIPPLVETRISVQVERAG